MRWNSSVSEDLQKEHIPECRPFKKLQNEKNDLHKSMTLTEIYNKAMAKFSEDNGTFQQIKKFMTELAVGTDENPLIKDSLVREVYNKSRK
ncbi:hypothetical protein TVAG_255250 [Trichomonas vaginalis G3]|uniref:Uncharacterized protein n=1 Tax=Trichomonas vaginalis (strain ATCC PRA-98 / G3) TaxID=412133 RepID=A2FPY5_TRIV3|nr:hypothetical protein TVAG_255250 [Trichomonas vaginalis G3]|eukprot:XP_001305974.1 hypothetical protein [Trichomonas vaginalis G3]